MRAHLLVVVLACLACGLAGGHPVEQPKLTDGQEQEGDDEPLGAGAGGRADCKPSETAVDTAARLSRLRALMAEHGVDAYVVPTEDEHGSEYTAEAEKRRHWITGFTGSAGTAVVTASAAALWTDSRYWAQAERETDCRQWRLMRSGQPGVPSITSWIESNVGRDATVGADPRLVSHSLWTAWNSRLTKRGVRMRAVHDNLIDIAWGADRPEYPDSPIVPYDIKYAGETWQSKVRRLQDWLRAQGSDLLVINALDDCAYLLNLRGAEVPMTPLFRCYVAVARDALHVFLPASKASDKVREHLSDPAVKTELHDYQDVWSVLPRLAANSSVVAVTKDHGYHHGASQRVHQTVPADKVRLVPSPVLFMKAEKNEVEAAGMRRAHVKDAVALIEMLSILAEEVPRGEYWDELKVVDKLDRLRRDQEGSHGISFHTIAAFGVNSALPHYVPSNATNLRIGTDNLFMLDSGGQYDDGTTDVTRTVHLGTPTPEQVHIYTKLLQGCLRLVNTVFPKGGGFTMQKLDIIIREPLFSLGLQYGHGSTHGIGHFNVLHESFDFAYKEGFFGSQEPGYYRVGDFGMRLENIVTVKQVPVKYETSTKFLSFEPVTLVPYDRKLIDLSQLSKTEIGYLNAYYERIREVVGAELLRQDKKKVHDWLMEQTKPFPS